MPQRNSRKTYIDHGYYHIYNRGVEKRIIFNSLQDYNVFLGYLCEYLSPSTIGENSIKSKHSNARPGPLDSKNQYYQRKCYANVLQLQAYVLMPNHFHFLIRQVNSVAMKEFIQSLCTRYSMYFNRQSDRVGSLFQGRYKAVMVRTDEQLIHVSRYIHLNPLDLGFSTETLQNYTYSS